MKRPVRDKLFTISIDIVTMPERTYLSLSPEEKREVDEIFEGLRAKSEEVNALYEMYIGLCNKRFGAEEGSEESASLDKSIKELLRKKQSIEEAKNEIQRQIDSFFGRNGGASKTLRKRNKRRSMTRRR